MGWKEKESLAAEVCCLLCSEATIAQRPVSCEKSSPTSRAHVALKKVAPAAAPAAAWVPGVKLSEKVPAKGSGVRGAWRVRYKRKSA